MLPAKKAIRIPSQYGTRVVATRGVRSGLLKPRSVAKPEWYLNRLAPLCKRFQFQSKVFPMCGHRLTRHIQCPLNVSPRQVNYRPTRTAQYLVRAGIANFSRFHVLSCFHLIKWIHWCNPVCPENASGGWNVVIPCAACCERAQK